MRFQLCACPLVSWQPRACILRHCLWLHMLHAAVHTGWHALPDAMRCTGAIACALAKHLQSNQGFEADAAPAVVAADVEAAALAYTALNAERLGVGPAIRVVESNWCGSLQHLAGQCAGVLSNPPYIPEHKLDSLQAEVARCA